MSYAGDGGGGRHHGNHFNSGRGSGGGGRYAGGGGGRYQGGGGGGGGGGRYQGGGGGGRGGRYQGGGGGGGGGRSGRGGGGNANHGLLSVCRDFTRTGQCPHGSSCHYAHVVQLHATIAAATKPPIQQQQQQQQQQGNYKNYNNNAAAVATVSSIAIWEPPGNPVFKIFTSSSDGYWRLWDTAGGQFKQEFENNMAGHVHKCIVSYDHTYLFCGFEAPCRAIPSPNITVGMVHGWNLQQPSQPPLELQIQPSSSSLSNGNGTSSGATTPTASNGSHHHQQHPNPTHTSIPYAHNMAVSAIHMASPSTTTATSTSSTGGSNNVNGGTTDVIQIATGSRDGSIRIWAYRNGSFVLVRSLCGHAREVTGLVLLSAQNILWSASIDQCIRIWNTMTGDCQYCIAGSSVVDPSVPPPIMNAPATAAAAGHSMPITALIPYISSAGTFILSASLDQTVKVWNAVTGECVASESHSEAITCMTIARDLGNNELLLLGMESGAIQCRNIQPYANIAAFQLIFTLTAYHNVGHEGAVKCITAGPSGTFYSGGVDGKMLVCSFCGDLGLNA